MATIRKRGGVYYLDYRVNGKRKRKKVGKSKQVAELALKDVEVKIAKNEIGIVERDLPLGKLFQEFLEYSKTNHKPSTTSRYEDIINNFSKFLEDHPEVTKLSHLRANLFERYKNYRRNGENSSDESGEHKRKSAKTRTVNNEITMLRAIFNMAIKWGYLRENPTKDVSLLKTLDTRPFRFLTKEECKLLLENCGEKYYPVFYTFIYTGKRRGELLNLEWNDIDFQRSKIMIHKKPFWSPKTGEREIPMSRGLAEVLRKLKKKQGKKSRFVKHSILNFPICNTYHSK